MLNVAFWVLGTGAQWRELRGFVEKLPARTYDPDPLDAKLELSSVKNNEAS